MHGACVFSFDFVWVSMVYLLTRAASGVCPGLSAGVTCALLGLWGMSTTLFARPLLPFERVMLHCSVPRSGPFGCFFGKRTSSLLCDSSTTVLRLGLNC